ncbi:hypothetical protein F9L33_07060 [Amylibacter sp. SFDW26]|uniref:CobW family GTP-binding protein n=1 Tax=Amylibacter sp. SFDW26 TaxID=2652722 RepID=UPI0012616848|nr:GTP-binding protein [Amylibacter sp. SFDW26]KAB7614398.1 hypothetical protein F9L33_07060 [Amylibacter sp. SFDW26]
MVSKAKNRLPIITIGGFLGSGKTTLVNRILSQANGKRYVVFVNDFGAINIDFEKIETVEENRISLKNGCVCCSLNDDLVAGIADFARQEILPDAIIIEASGVSDPRALDASLDMLEAAGLTRLDTKLYVLDAYEFCNLNFEDSEYILDCAAVSDLVLLNKVDITPKDRQTALTHTLKDAAPFTNVVSTSYCSIDVSILISREIDIAVRETKKKKFNSLKAVNHTEHYKRWSAETGVLIDREQFASFARMLPKYCYRAKGILRFSDAPETPYLFDLVGYRATIEAAEKPLQLQKMSSQIVAIGDKNTLCPEYIGKKFSEILMKSPTAHLSE